MYKLLVKKGVKGKAWFIVPISESLVDRAVFNACIRIVFGREVETDEEMERVAIWKDERENKILKFLKEYGKSRFCLDADFKRLEDFMFKKLKGGK